MSEWSLIVFTIAIQAAAGLALAATVNDRGMDAVSRPLGIAVFPVAVSGLLVSLLHLGRPLLSWKALMNLESSRLSWEVLLTSVFVAAASAYSYSWWADHSGHRFLLGVVTSLLGIAAVAAGAAVYVVPAQPAWNSGWVPLSFLATMILVGACASAAAGVPRSAAAVTAGGLLMIAAAAWMRFTATQTVPDAFAAAQLQSAHQYIASHPYWFGAHVLTAAVLPIALVLLRIPSAALVCALAGAVLGRSFLFGVAPKQLF